MSLLTITFTLLCYFSVALCLLGMCYRIYRYAKTPIGHSVPLTPAPTTRIGVALRLFNEVIFFKSLFRASKWTWLLGWLFHAALLLVLLRHLHYFFATAPVWMYQIQQYSHGGAVLMLLALGGLWARRLLVDRVRYISAPSDHLMLALIIAIGLSGMAMKTGTQTDMGAVKAFVRGLIDLDWQPFPADGFLSIHLGLVAILLMVFPFSKLLHAPGVFFSPTLTQRDNLR